MQYDGQVRCTGAAGRSDFEIKVVLRGPVNGDASQKGNMDETYAYFTIDGSGKSSAITELLGITPDEEFSEGDCRKRTRTYKSMKWKLYSRLAKDGALHDTLEQHINDVLSRVEKFKDKLTLLGGDYEPYIQCVAYYHGAQLGYGLSKRTVERAAELGLGIDFDLYSLSDTNEDV